MKKISYILFSVLIMFVSINNISANGDERGTLMAEYETSCKQLGEINDMYQNYDEKIKFQFYKDPVGGNYIRVNGYNMYESDDADATSTTPPDLCGYIGSLHKFLIYDIILTELDLFINDIETKPEAPSLRFTNYTDLGMFILRPESSGPNYKIDKEIFIKPTKAPGSQSYKPPAEEENPDELHVCYYKSWDEGINHRATFTYNKTKGTITLSDNSYDPLLSPDRIRGNLVNMLKSGSCPSKIELCLPASGGYYFTDNCNTVDWEEFFIVNYEGEYIPSEEYRNSDEYKELLGGLKVPLSKFAPEVLSYKLTVDAKLVALSDIPNNNTICDISNCKEPEYKAKVAIRKIKAYCQDLNKFNYINSERPEKRIAECESFEEFYNKLLQDGVISNIAEGCGILTSDLKDKVIMVLDIIKIAGPVLALVLGMLDFTKAVVASDADKEMKAAGKKFVTRLMAAALLFLIPALLGVVLRPVLGDKMGGDLYCEIFRE